MMPLYRLSAKRNNRWLLQPNVSFSFHLILRVLNAYVWKLIKKKKYIYIDKNITLIESNSKEICRIVFLQISIVIGENSLSLSFFSFVTANVDNEQNVSKSWVSRSWNEYKFDRRRHAVSEFPALLLAPCMVQFIFHLRCTFDSV